MNFGTAINARFYDAAVSGMFVTAVPQERTA